MATEDMTTQQVSRSTQLDQLLNPEQRIVCEQVAVGETLNSRRAQALLVVDSGATQAEAGRQAGLTLYQVKYCLIRFRQLGVAMFPPVTTAATQPEPDLSPDPVLVPDPAPIPEPVTEPEQPVSAGEAEMVVGKPDDKAADKTPKGKKGKKKSKKGKGRKKGGKSKSGKSSKKKGKKKGAKKNQKKSKKSKKKSTGGKKGRKSKSGKSSGKKSKKKDKR